MAKFIKLVNGELLEEQTVTTSAGASDAGKLINLDAAGLIDSSFIPGAGPAGTAIPAFENLLAGDFVNVFDDAGTVKVRKADASSVSTKADGYVTANVTAPANAAVYFSGQNTALSGLTFGVTYFLSETSGLITSTPPAASGAIIQQIGTSLSATSVNVDIKQTIELV